MVYVKNFDSWNIEKQKADSKIISQEILNGEDVIRKWEIRWCALGVNIGSEIDGKGKEFLRPCLLIEEATPDIFLAIPMSTKVKTFFGYRNFVLDGEKVSLCLHQLKTISRKRIYGRLGKVSENKIKEIRKEIIKYFNLDK